MDLIKEVQNEFSTAYDAPAFGAGDTVAVSYKIREGEKERIQQYTGVVLQRSGIGVERIFPLHSPFIDDIKVLKQGAVRRARIFYFRERTGKSARIREKRRY